MIDTLPLLRWQDIAAIMVLVVVLLAGIAGVYAMQRRHTRRELDAITMQERHLYRALHREMKDLEALRMAHHDAQNELIVLQGFLERGETAQARRYLAELLHRDSP